MWINILFWSCLFGVLWASYTYVDIFSQVWKFLFYILLKILSKPLIWNSSLFFSTPIINRFGLLWCLTDSAWSVCALKFDFSIFFG